jgi:hypothetical protein
VLNRQITTTEIYARVDDGAVRRAVGAVCLGVSSTEM